MKTFGTLTCITNTYNFSALVSAEFCRLMFLHVYHCRVMFEFHERPAKKIDDKEGRFVDLSSH